MRGPALIIGSAICLCVLVLVVAKDIGENDDVRLKISIRRDNLKRVSSCQHTFSQVELLNLHATEAIMIHSIQTAPEETVLVRSATGETVSRSWDDGSVPQQLHVSRLPTGSLSLGPGQVAIVPVTFLPRFPNLEHENAESAYREAIPPPLLSASSTADLVELVGEEILNNAEYIRATPTSLPSLSSHRRSNLDPTVLSVGDEFEVSTTVVVDTSRGIVKLPIRATSIRDNTYGIPDVIRFYHKVKPKERVRVQEDSQKDEDLKKTKPSSSSSSSKGSLASLSGSGVVLLDTLYTSHEGVPGKGRHSSSEPERDCYDLFLSNPSPDKDMEVSEVLISRPEMMSVEFDPRRLLLTADIPLITTGPSQVIREWTEEGPMYLPPDSEDNYVATVCTSTNGGVLEDDKSGLYLEEMSNWIDSGNPEKSLGFLQVRTDSETLFIGLERAEAVLPPLLLKSSLEQRDQASLASSSPTNINAAASPSSALLRAVPERINFRVLSSANPVAIAKISLQNKSPVPIRMMRVSVGMDTTGDDDKEEMAKRIGLKMKVVIGKNGSINWGSTKEAEAPLKPFVLPAAGTVDDAMAVSCSVSWNSALVNLNQDSFQFSGTLILRGTMDTELNYNEWRHEMLENPYRDFHLVLEIPYSITVLNGRVEVIIERSTHPYPQIWGAQPWDRSGRAISALFFPLTQFEVLDDPNDPLPTQSYRGDSEIGHDLRIISNMAIQLSLEDATVLDGNSTTTGELAADSLCRRFNVSLTSSTEVSSSYPEFEELGFLALQYNFPDYGRSGQKRRSLAGSQEIVHTTTCYLNVITSPVDTGVHRVPLIIFPGQLDVSYPKALLGTDLDKSEVATPEPLKVSSGASASPLVGFDRTLAWFRESALGNSLRAHLESVVDDRRSLRNDAHLLGKYLLQLCPRGSDTENLTLRPILLKAGAIEQNEVVRTPLYITNHNPVPIRVQIDVGEVEGMSIALGRDFSRGRGDGNNMLDYLPRQRKTLDPAAKNGLVKDGKYRGHPLQGLRQYLLSNDRALSFASQFSYRDAVSLNPAAVALQPILKSLYKWHSYIEFHRGPLPHRFGPNGESRCEGSEHPPMYHSFNNTEPKSRLHAQPSPFMISGDKSIARSLKTCWDSSMEESDISDGTNVLIPPGGVARFDVRVRAPPQESLKNDISQLIATGLVLSTNYGEVLPIVATFEALQGQLHVASAGIPQTTSSGEFEIFQENEHIKVIRVPLGLFWNVSRAEKNQNATALSIPPSQYDAASHRTINLLEDTRDADPTQQGVSLFLQSSFSREVRLLEIDSCNPWFDVSLRDARENDEYDKELGVDIGSVRSVVSCDSAKGDAALEFPSYYQCVLNWLERRAELQPRGCGLLPDLRKRSSDPEGGLELGRQIVERAVKAFEPVLRVLKKADPPFANADAITQINGNGRFQESFAAKSGTKRRDGYLAPSALDVFVEAWDAWRFSAEYGLRVLSSSLRATIDYDTFSRDTEDRKNNVGRQSLALSMHNLAVETVLETPKLFDSKRARRRARKAVSPDGDEPSIIEFPSTLVANVVSLTIPLRNPTSVPVRVRISAAPPTRPTEDVLDSQDGDNSVDDTLRSRFLQNTVPPYVQNGQAHALQNEIAHHLWWDGGGAFFTSDERGDLVRSHHNITIRAGAGAHVSLVNPALHANIAVLVGCGSRCGLRDDTQGKGEKADLKQTSPFGAAAASGISLLGKKRSNVAQSNAVVTDEVNILAGGSPLSATGGPAAFAIPFSALDEIVIPPFGVGEIGPIFFRPPGRYGVLGCESAIESGASFWGEKTAEACESRSFESMLFLENSLTGLERVVLRGKGMLERISFLDPLPEDGADAFGDIEFRNGRPTLVFTGTSEKPNMAGSNPTSRWLNFAHTPRTVVKEVVVHNDGDVIVDIANVYLSDTTKGLENPWSLKGSKGITCDYGSFRLLNCWASNLKVVETGSEVVNNLGVGFQLHPGENRSVFVEHVPDCSRQEEFVSLNVEYRRPHPSIGFGPSLDRGILALSRSGEVRNAKVNEWRRAFRKRKVELLVGYAMNKNDFSHCMPVDANGAIPVPGGETNAVIRGRSKGLSENRSSYRAIFLFRRVASKSFAKKMAMLLLTLLLLASSVALLAQSWYARHKAAVSFWMTLRRSRVKTDGSSRSSAQQGQTVVHGNWQAAFRCLARADPTSAELQTLGKEQVRQIIFGRYRTMGVIPPQCFNSAGVFSRERAGVLANNGSRQRIGKEGGSSSNERVRTLSDSIFNNVSAEKVKPGHRQLPAGLGWRAAVSRGLLDAKAAGSVDAGLKTTALMTDRSKIHSMGPPLDPPVEAGAENSVHEEPHEIDEREEVVATDSKEDEDAQGESVESSDDVVSTSESESTETKADAAPNMVKLDKSDAPRGSPEDTQNGPPKIGAEGNSKSTKPGEAHIDDGEEKHDNPKATERDGSRGNAEQTPTPGVQGTTPVTARKSSHKRVDSETSHEVAASSGTSKPSAHARSASKKPRDTQVSNESRGKKEVGTPRSNRKPVVIGDRASSGSKQPGNTNSPSVVSPEPKSKSKSAKSKNAKAKSAASKKKRPPSPVRSSSPLSANIETPLSKPTQGVLRPPPGLAPPPGFHRDDSRPAFIREGSLLSLALIDASGNQPALGDMLDAVLSNSTMNLTGGGVLPFSQASSRIGDLLFTGSLPPPSSPPLGTLGAPSPRESIGLTPNDFGLNQSINSLGPLAPLLVNEPANNSTDGFDVMDFLDGILNDGNSAEELDAGAPGVLLSPDAGAPLLSNPWASEGRSRASAYGISFDEAEEISDRYNDGSPSFTVRANTPTDDESASGFGSIPLLTPAAILMAGQDDDDSADGDENGNSFYASLMGE